MIELNKAEKDERRHLKGLYLDKKERELVKEALEEYDHGTNIACTDDCVMPEVRKLIKKLKNGK